MDALDRELDHALAVDPSPEFVARVRARVANEPAPSSWRMPRMLMAGVALAAVTLVAVVMPRPREIEVTPRRLEAEVVQAFTPVVPAEAAGVQVLRPAETPAPSIHHRRVRQSPAPIQFVSVADMPNAPMGAVVPAMTFDDVVTMTGVHP
jgi:hypothetical protein